MDINDFDLTAVQMFENSMTVVKQSEKEQFLKLFEKALLEKVLSSLTRSIQKESDKGNFKTRVTEYYNRLLTSIENDKEFNSKFKKFLVEYDNELDDMMFDKFLEVCDKVYKRLIINGFKVSRKVVDSKGFRSITFSIVWNLEKRDDSAIKDCDYVKLDCDYINGK